MKVDPKDCVLDFEDGQFWCYASNIVYPAYFMPLKNSPHHFRINTMGDEEAASCWDGLVPARMTETARVMLVLIG